MKKRMVALVAFFVAVTFFGQIADALVDDAKAKLKALKPSDYPTKVIEFVGVYAPGGTLDLCARLVAKYVEKYTDSRCIVVNKTGGGGLIGHTYLATQAKNDGYTVGVLSTSFLSDEITKAQGKWSYKNLEPLNFLNFDNVTWIVRTEGPLKDKSAKDVLAMAKENPETLKIGIVPGMSFQFLLEDAEMTSGAKFIAVPFQGAAPGLVALLGGHLDLATSFYGEYKSYLEANKIKVIAAAGSERSSYLPGVPTLNEVLGVKHILWSTWKYTAVPKGVAPDRFKYLEAAIDAAIHDPDFINEFDKIGMKAGPYMSSAETADALKRMYDSYLNFFTKTGRVSK